MDSVKQILTKTEEMERQLHLLESRMKKQLNLISCRRDSLELKSGMPAKVCGFRTRSASGEALVLAEFCCSDYSAAGVTIQLTANGIAVAERKVPACCINPVYLIFKKTLFNLQAAEFTLELKAGSDVFLENLEISVIACNAVKTGN